MHIVRVALAVGLGTTTVAAFSCAATSTHSGGNSSVPSGAGGAVSSGGAASSGGGKGSGGEGGSLFDLPDSGPLDANDDAPCALITKEAKNTPLDLYIAFDKSSSMAGFKWDNAKVGLTAFLNDAASVGLKVAINFFPLDNNPTCDQHAYAPPVVNFDLLPQNATPIEQAMNATSPNGFNTPIYPALGGALLAATAEAQQHPGDTAAVLLVTDGQPQGPSSTCSGVDPQDPAAIAALATAGASAGVKTFVIGLPGVSQTIANQIAAAGGTVSAILVGATNVTSEFQSALAKVHGEALPCSYDVPAEVAGGQVDFNHVNVVLTPGSGTATVLPQNPTCNGNGWRYDDPTKPKTIVFCSKTCTALKADLKAQAQIELGCQTQVVN